MKKLLLMLFMILMLTSCQKKIEKDIEKHFSYFEDKGGLVITYPFVAEYDFSGFTMVQLETEIDLQNRVLKYKSYRLYSLFKPRNLSNFYYYEEEDQVYFSLISNDRISHPVNDLQFNDFVFPINEDMLKDADITETDEVRTYTLNTNYDTNMFMISYFEGQNEDYLEDTYPEYFFDNKYYGIPVKIEAVFNIDLGYFEEIILDFSEYVTNNENQVIFRDVRYSKLKIRFNEFTEDLIPEESIIDDYVDSRNAREFLVKEIVIDEIINCSSDYYVDQDYFKIDIKERGNYQIELFDVSDEDALIKTRFDHQRYDGAFRLAPGVIYIKIENISPFTEKIEFSFKVVKVPDE